MPINFNMKIGQQVLQEVQQAQGAQTKDSTLSQKVQKKASEMFQAVVDTASASSFLKTKHIALSENAVISAIVNKILSFLDTKESTQSKITERQGEILNKLNQQLENSESKPHVCYSALEDAVNSEVLDYDLYCQIRENFSSVNELPLGASSDVDAFILFFEAVTDCINNGGMEAVVDAAEKLQDVPVKEREAATELLAKAIVSKGGVSQNLGGSLEAANERRSEVLSYIPVLVEKNQILTMKLLQQLTADSKLVVEDKSYRGASPKEQRENLAIAKAKLQEIATKAENLGLFRLRNEIKSELASIEKELQHEVRLDQAVSKLSEKVPELDVNSARGEIDRLLAEKKPGTHSVIIGNTTLHIVVVAKKGGEVDLLFRPENFFAKGAAGQVFKGTSLFTGQDYAVKSPIVIDGDVDQMSLDAIKYEGSLFSQLQRDGSHPGILQAELHGDDLVMDFFELGDYQKQISIGAIAGFFGCDDLSMLSMKIDEKYSAIQNELDQASTTDEKKAIVSRIMSDVDIENFKVLVGESAVQNFRRGLLEVASGERELEPLYKEFTQKVADVMQKKAKPSSLEQEMRFCAELTGAMQHMHACGIFHADIKPLNELWDGQRCVTADLGDSKNLADIVQAMRPEIGIKNRSERLQMIALLDAIDSRDVDQISSRIETNKAQYDKLFELGVLKKTKEGFSVDNEKFKALKRFLTQTDTPANTGGTMGFRNPIYQEAAREYFLCGNQEGVNRALMANDMCARAVANYVHLTGAALPTESEQGVRLDNLGKPQKDSEGKTYYDRMEENLLAKGIDPAACRILRRMAEPVFVDPKNLPDPFPLPVTDEEITKLQQLLNPLK